MMSNHSIQRVNYPARSVAPELPFSLTCTHALKHMFVRCGWQALRSATAAAQPAAGASSRGPIPAEPSDTFDPENDSVVDEEEHLSVVHSASTAAPAPAPAPAPARAAMQAGMNLYRLVVVAVAAARAGAQLLCVDEAVTAAAPRQ